MPPPIKICIWMDIPSHYQSAFFAALQKRNDIDLHVRYFRGSDLNRFKEGWQSNANLKDFEKCVEGISDPRDMIESVSDWKQRIHVCCRSFNPGLVNLFCRENVKWCHWSEMPGINLAAKLGYRVWLFRFFKKIYYMTKYAEGKLIAKSALGAFGQGYLARKAFVEIGIPENKIADLYYAPNSLQGTALPSEIITNFLQGRKSFLFVGSLCKRKGIDVLLKAFGNLNKRNWCLVLCGLDKTCGEYQKLAKSLDIIDNVMFLGPYPIESISEVYRACDVCVLPSRFDGWGAVLNEAASIGMPLIATDMCGASWHVIEDGKNGFKVKTESIKDLARALRPYTQQPDLLKIHGEYSRNLFLGKFTPEQNAERLVTSLKKWQEQ